MDEPGNGPPDRMGTPYADQWTHRQALQIIAELPDDIGAAVAVLDRARFLLQQWRLRSDAAPDLAVVVPLRAKVVG